MAGIDNTVIIDCLAQQKHSDVPANKNVLVATTNISCGAVSMSSTNCRQSITNGFANKNDPQEMSLAIIVGKVRCSIQRTAAEYHCRSVE